MASFIIIGSGTLPAACADRLLDRGHSVIAVAPADAPLRVWAERTRTPTLTLTATPPARPDFLLSIVNLSVLSPAVLAWPTRLALNYHDGPLPRYAGLNVTQWALLHGESVHGVCWHAITPAGIDAGAVYARRAVPVGPADTALTLNAACYTAALAAFEDLLKAIETDSLAPQPQDLRQRTYFAKARRPPRLVTWGQPAVDLHRLMRALDTGPYANPLGWPVLHLPNGDWVSARHSQPASAPPHTPAGTVLARTPAGLVVACAEGALELTGWTTLDGAPLDLAALPAPGDLWPDPPPPTQTAIHAALQASAPHDDFWRAAWAGVEPTDLPHPTSPNPALTGETWRVPLPPGYTPASAQAMMLAWLARLTGQNTVHIGLDVGPAVPPLHARHAPLSVTFDLNQPLTAALTALTAALTARLRRPPPPLDLPARYPDLPAPAPWPLTLSAAPDLPADPTARLTLTAHAGAIHWHNAPALFAPAMLEAIADSLRAFAEAALTAPALSQAPLTSPTARRQFEQWNATAELYPRDPVSEHIAAQCRRHPQRVAVRTPAGEMLTYGDLLARAHDIATALRAVGVGPERLVAVQMERTPALVAALLGVWLSGGAYLPLDPAFPADRRAFMLADSGANAVLTTPGMAPPGPDQAWTQEAAWPDLCLWRTPHAPPAPSDPPADRLAYVLYTSGSTGKPKGVAVTHANLSNFLHSMARAPGLSAADTLAAVTTLSFDIAGLELWLPLLTGASLMLVNRATASDGSALAQMLTARAITVMQATPATWRLLVEAGWPGAPGFRALCGGEPLPRDLARALLTRVAELWNLYGPTETTIWSTLERITSAEAPITIGRPIANTTLHITLPDGQPAPVGVPGELNIGGAGVARGYLNRPELTAEKFFALPEGAPAYRTGDLARWLPDGRVDFLGRRDFQVKVRGFRIELDEIAAVLTAHPAVQQAVVTAHADTLAAYVVARSPVPADDLHAHLRARLPDYMLPAHWVFLPALPLTPNGKIDRKALPPPRAVPRAGLRPPQTEVERALAAIWRDVLEVSAVGLDDDFFALGGHSLSAARVLSRIRRDLGVAVTLPALFARPTLAALAEHVAGLRAEPQPATRPADPASAAPAPATPQQLSLWLAHRLTPDEIAYTIPLAVDLRGPLAVPRLQAALTALWQRHDSLRLTLPEHAGRPTLRLLTTPAWPLAVIPAETDDQADVFTPFDLETGPLARATLIRHHAQHHTLRLCLHHTIADGAALDILLRELAALYAEAPLPPAPAYHDYARAQAQADFAPALAYWREALRDLPGPVMWPLSAPRPPAPAYVGARYHFTVPPALASAARALAAAHKATPFMLALTALAVVIHRYTGQTDVVLGAPWHNRATPDQAALVGLLMNPVAVRLNLAGNPTLSEALERARTAVQRALAHGAAPLEQVLDAVQPRREPGVPPLFQAMLAWQTPLPQPPWPGLAVHSRLLDTRTAKLDLTLTVTEDADEWPAFVEYRADLFSPDSMARLAGHWLTVLEALTAQSAAPLARAPLLTPAETAQLRAWHATPAEPLTPFCIHDAIARCAESAPQATALVTARATLTYAELNARANQLAHFLLGLGVQADEVIGLCAERSADLVVWMLGVLKAGAAYLPLEADLPADRLAHMLTEARARYVLAHSHLAARLPAAAPVIDMGAAEAALSAQPTHNPTPAVTPAHLAYVLFTSGSTGQPKGVGVEHRHLSAYLAGVRDRLRLPPGARYALVSTLTADLGLTALYPALTSGGSLHLVAAETAADPDALAALFTATPVDCLKIVPSHLAALLSAERPEAVLPRQCLVLGGEAFDAALLRRLRALAPRLRILNHYGPTETTVGVTTFETPLDPAGLTGTVPLGYALPHTQLHVLDAHRQPVPVGVPGELYIAGAQVARGYLNRPELTAERFITLTDPPTRAYRTGDWVRRRADGALEFLGRIDQQVKIRGYRVELGEIEAVLRQADHVQAGVALARAPAPGAPLQLAAYVVPDSPGLEASALRARLRAYLRARLPDYMQPGAIVVLPALPLTANGKVDRAALPAPAPDHAPASADPQTPTERALADLWREVLRVPQVNRFDNFFALGGDSILSIQLVARAHRAGLHLLPRHLFQFPTLAELARALAETPAPAPAPPAPASAPLTPIQRWFFTAPHPAPHHWAMPMALVIRARLDPDLTRRALLALAEHHPMWRARFTLTANGWEQRLAAPGPADVLFFHETVATARAARAALARWGADLPARLNLTEGPVVAAVLIQQPARATLLIVPHHLVMDGVSWRLIREDFEQAYARLADGHAPALPPASAAFTAWADRLHAYAASPALQAEKAYWHALAAYAPAVSTPWGVEGETRAHTLTLSRTATARVLACARATHINSVLLAALAEALHAWDGQPAHLIDLEGHGREDLFADLNLSRTVGWFTTHYPMLIRASPYPLADMHAAWQAVPQHGLGYGVLRYLAGDPALQTPDPAIAFNYLGQFETPPTAWASLQTAVPGPSRHPASPRQHRLEINAWVQAGRLHAQWLFAPPHDTETGMARLAEAFARALTRLTRRPLPGHLLTALQRHMAESAYHPQITYTLRGPLRLADLRRAWAQVTARHAALRLSLTTAGTQTVHPRARLRWRVRDGRGQPAQTLADWRAAEARAPFDLTAPPLFRLLVIRLAEDTHQLVWTSHHLLKDGWSSAVIWREVWALYAGQTLPPAPQWLAEARPWPEPPLAGPAARLAPPGAQTTRLSVSATQAVHAWAQRHQLTLATVCAAVLQHALAGLAPTASLGWVEAHRPAHWPEVENTVGPLIALRPLTAPATLEPAALRAWQAQPPPVPPPAFNPAVTLRVQTYPRLAADLAEAGLTLIEQTWVDEWAYPLNIVVEPAPALTLTAAYDPARWSPPRVAAVLGAMRQALLSLPQQG